MGGGTSGGGGGSAGGGGGASRFGRDRVAKKEEKKEDPLAALRYPKPGDGKEGELATQRSDGVLTNQPPTVKNPVAAVDLNNTDKAVLDKWIAVQHHPKDLQGEDKIFENIDYGEMNGTLWGGSKPTPETSRFAVRLDQVLSKIKDTKMLASRLVFLEKKDIDAYVPGENFRVSAFMAMSRLTDTTQTKFKEWSGPTLNGPKTTWNQSPVRLLIYAKHAKNIADHSDETVREALLRPNSKFHVESKIYTPEETQIILREL